MPSMQRGGRICLPKGVKRHGGNGTPDGARGELDVSEQLDGQVGLAERHERLVKRKSQETDSAADDGTKNVCAVPWV